jgi:cation diffusion facilitator family transporter
MLDGAAPRSTDWGTPIEGRGGGGSLRTVVVAVVANVAVALAKAVAAVLTGSAALLAEALHSIADSGNEALLLVGLHRSSRSADAAHPLGYGQERYFWSFLAAIGIFLIGGILSIVEGVHSLLEPEPLTSPWLGIGVLVAAAFFESYSWTVARRQLRRGAEDRGRSIAQHIERASDPSATTVYLEDSAALVGIAMALLALILHLVTGQAVWDAAASIGIGVLLIVVAYLLARRSKALLIDESAPADVLSPIREAIGQHRWVADVRRLEGFYVGPSRLLVIARIQIVEELRTGPAEDLLRGVATLRAELLRSPAIAEVALSIAPPEDR